jgi:hypothetical protein
MPNIITNQLRIDNAKNFIGSVETSTGNSLYMFLGKPNSWSEETAPDVPADTLGYSAKIWDEMIGLKRITTENIAHVVKRIDWKKDTVYDEYDNNDAMLFGKHFYVLNSEFNVYKCISNNSGAASTIEPMGQNLDIITLSDNYRWKYLYHITAGDQIKFLTNNWMPVLLDDDVSANAKGGAIEQIRLLNGGQDYSASSTIVISGDGQDAEILPKLSLGVLYDFTYKNIGRNYRYATAVLKDNTNSGKYANIQVVVSPYKGHGYDPISELGAYSLMLNVKTDYNEGFGDFPGSFSYRNLGIIKNPIDNYNNVANAITLSALTGIYVSTVSGTFLQNEFIEGITSLANAYIVTSNINSGNGYIKFIRASGLTSNYDNFMTDENVIGTRSGATAKVSGILSSEIIPNTGDVYYVENKTPITRSLDQTDVLHLVIEF